MFEINGNLADPEYGLSNYADFSSSAFAVFEIFQNLFGHRCMRKIRLYVDNAYSSDMKNNKARSYSGFSPICTPVFKEFIVIKLSICPTDKIDKITYQLAHEMGHFVFYSHFGFEKPFANIHEENICSAMSLCILKKHVSPISCFDAMIAHAQTLTDKRYKYGAMLADAVNYDIYRLRDMILCDDYSSIDIRKYLAICDEEDFKS